jgi:eukaryotic-like serine/threonine-protein kinase
VGSLPATIIEGKYEILAKIKEGGMGAIYKVRHRLLDEIRVVKVMRPQLEADEEWKKRFLQEARMATRLKHPNIATLYDFTIDADGTAYMVMEFIEGQNLSEILSERGRLPVGLTLELMQQTLKALSYLHRQGIVHRDVSPDNLMLTRDAEGEPLIKLIDLGIAKALKADQNLTSTGVFLGKVKYTSPEQVGQLKRGETLDGRSDIYSCGIVVYELLTGKLPFEAESPHGMLAAHLFHPPADFSVTDPENFVPEDVRAAIGRMLEKRRDNRYADAEKTAQAFAELHARHRTDEDRLTLERLLVGRSGSGPSGSGTPHGTTQEKLNYQFGPSATPIPTRPVSGPPPMTGPRDLSPEPGETVRFPPSGASVAPGDGGELTRPTSMLTRASARPAPTARTRGTRTETPVARGRIRPRILWAAAVLIALGGMTAYFLTRSTAPVPETEATSARPAPPKAPATTVSSASTSPSVSPQAPVSKAIVEDSGSLFVESLCPAEIVSITDLASGRTVHLPADASTPLRIPLAPGRYRIESRSDACGGEAVKTVEIRSNTLSEARLDHRPTGLTADELLRPPQ